MDNLNKNKIKESIAQKIRAMLSSCFQFLHKRFLWGVFSCFEEKFFKFLFVGALNVLFAYLIYALFIAFGAKANVALFFQYILGVIWNFKTTGTIVFKNNNNKLIFKFFASYIFTFSINYILLNTLTKFLNDYLSQAILILPIAFLSFTILKIWVFKK